MPWMPGAAVAVALVASELDEARSLSLQKTAAGCLAMEVGCTFSYPSFAMHHVMVARYYEKSACALCILEACSNEYLAF
jgi:hypothetical protein